MDWESLAANAPGALRHWTGAEPISLVPVEAGTLNWNFRVDFGNRRCVLRCHRDNLETERIEGEHALLAWVSERGIPAPVPVPTSAGETLVEWGGHRWSLAPWMRGELQPRGTLSGAQAHALGAMQGRIQSLLGTHPESRDPALTLRWDIEDSLVRLATLVEVARKRQEASWIVDALVRQRRLLAEADALTPVEIDTLPRQLLHGDFHDQQVLFEGGEVTAVLDWEIWRTDPRAWELVRSLSFSKVLDSPPLESYVAGYRQHVHLGEDEIRLALSLWFQSRIAGTWAWWAYFVDGNDRVRDFFPDMVAELDRITTPGCTDAATERVVDAACR